MDWFLHDDDARLGFRKFVRVNSREQFEACPPIAIFNDRPADARFESASRAHDRRTRFTRRFEQRPQLGAPVGPGDCAKRCLSQDPGPRAYSAAPKIS